MEDASCARPHPSKMILRQEKEGDIHVHEGVLPPSETDSWLGGRPDMGFPIDPEGFYEAIRGVSVLGKPIYVTETGIADATDAHRPYFINSHVDQVRPGRVLLHEPLSNIFFRAWQS